LSQLVIRRAVRLASSAAAPRVGAPEFERSSHAECDRERDQQAGPGRVLERLAAKVAKERSVERPQDARDGVEHGEPQPRVPYRPCAERHGDPATRDEAGDEDEFAAALGQLALSPANRLTPLLAAEVAGSGMRAETVAYEVRSVVASERTASRGRDDERQAELTSGGHHAGGDHSGFAGYDRQQRVEEREHKHNGIS